MAVVTLDYNDLIAGVDLSPLIEQAYGYDGLGVLTVKNVPGWAESRQKLLPLAQRFATLPDAIKDQYSHEESKYSFGWSHGKENLQGKPDFAKRSYYNNPQYDRPVASDALIAKHSPFIHPNIWPTADLPELEGAFKELGQLIVSVGTLVAQQCDRYVSKRCPGYREHYLEEVIRTSLCCKARLLHYFSTPVHVVPGQEKDDDFSSWCGWHNDHGSLTGLCSAMFLDENGREIENTDPTAGLYIRSRHSELVKVGIPRDHVAFQIGETAQVHSGGILQATPHAVRGSAVPGVTRETFAVFMEPNWFEPMAVPASVDPSSAQSQSSAENLPKGVPSIAARWKPGMDFNAFTDETLRFYYS